MKQVTDAVHARDLTAFVAELQREPWLLGDDFVWFQDRVIGIATSTRVSKHSSARFSTSILRSCGASRRRRRSTSNRH